MTSDDIKNSSLSEQGYLKEIAYQLALLNERSAEPHPQLCHTPGCGHVFDEPHSEGHTCPKCHRVYEKAA